MRLEGIISVLIVAFTLFLICVLFLGQTCLQDGVQCQMKSSETLESNCDNPGLFKSHPGCCPHKDCPADHHSFFLRSGVANVVGPKICFNNKIVMGGILNSVGWGLNIVLAKGETGEILRTTSFCNNPGGVIDLLKVIEDGTIVLVASYEDPALCLTDEIKEIFAGLGSTLIRSVKHRDTWLFAGAARINKESSFEKLIANEEKSNLYGDYPEMGEVEGCFPRTF